jgi:thiol:disulfide interchange protein
LPSLPSRSRNRHDPYWDVDGSAARESRKRRRIRESLAFGSAVVAVAGAALAWCLHLGVAHAAGISLAVRLG